MPLYYFTNTAVLIDREEICLDRTYWNFTGKCLVFFCQLHHCMVPIHTELILTFKGTLQCLSDFIYNNIVINGCIIKLTLTGI